MEHSAAVKALAILYYMLSSMTVQFMSKAVFTTFGFHYPISLALAQTTIMAPVCFFAARPKLEWRLARIVCPLTIVHMCNVLLGLLGTQGLNVPMFIALRRFTLLFTIVLERIYLSKQHDKQTLGAVGLMLLGAIIAALYDLTFSLPGYAAVLGNDIMTAVYLITVKNLASIKELTSLGLLFYNSMLCWVPLALLSVVSGEASTVFSQPQWSSGWFRVTLFLSAATGLTVNHSTFICTRVNEPLTTSVAGNLKNIIVTVMGAILFSDFQYNLFNVVGLAISMVGALWYAGKSTLQQMRAARAAVSPRAKDLEDKLDKQMLVRKA